MSLLNQEQTQLVAGRVQPMQVIVGVMAIGILSFCGIILVLKNFALQPQFDLFCMIGFAFTLPSIMISVYFKLKVTQQAAQSYLRKISRSESVSDSDVDALLGIFATNMVISSALIEGPAFFWAVVYMIGDGNAIGIIMAAILAVLVMFNIPTKNKLLDWFDRQIRISSQNM